MCTATWLYRANGYTLFFNRDELRQRLPAAPPSIHSKSGTSFLAALDGNHGGTWLAVNDRGMTLCLLNGEPLGPEPAGPERVSRGLLPTALIDARSSAQLEARLLRHEISRFRAFVLAGFDAQGPAFLASWNGRSLQHRQRPDLPMPLVSSSFRGKDVRQQRLAHFQRLDIGSGSPGERAEKHDAYHRSHWPERGPYSTCMHREEARTVSFSRIDVGPRSVSFRYRPGPPCADARAVEIGLSRTQ